MKPKVVVLLSGGLDSAVTLYLAGKKGYDCRCLAFYYGQRNARRELAASRRIARSAKCPISIVRLKLPWGGSSLVDRSRAVPMGRTAGEIKKSSIPSTYVPARNTIFLAIAASYAEAAGAGNIFIGAHFEDSSGYPDCRKGYLAAYDRVIRMGTRRGLEKRLKLSYPLINKDKKQIIKLGRKLGVPFEKTWSCYNGFSRPCAGCDACVLRARGFKAAGIKDPLSERV